jgi:Signal transduction histidine kinase
VPGAAIGPELVAIRVKDDERGQPNTQRDRKRLDQPTFTTNRDDVAAKAPEFIPKAREVKLNGEVSGILEAFDQDGHLAKKHLGNRRLHGLLETAVVASFSDSTGLEPASRPPAPVEFALYRIGREAVVNALQHARARNVTIGGRIGREWIDLVISDDGIGVDKERSRLAAGRGRLGLASMRRRAKAIGAELAIEGTAAGTQVVVAWRT